MRRIVVSSLMFFLMFLSITSMTFAESPWDKTDVDPFHNWTITFNEEVDNNTINEENIFVIKDSNVVQDIQVYINNDKKSVTVVAPNEGYMWGEQYVLYISNEVRSLGNKKLKAATNMQFTIKQQDETENNVPILIQDIANQEMKLGESITLDLLKYFSDPDQQDSLNFTATAGTIRNNEWTFVGNELKDMSVTITATDSKGKSIRSTFHLTVKPAQTQEDTLYNAIYNALINIEPEIDVSRFTTNSKVAFETYHKILHDHSEIYYSAGVTFWSSGRLELRYTHPKSQIIEMNKQIEERNKQIEERNKQIEERNNKVEQVAQKIISENIYPGMTEFEKVKAIHDYVVLNTAYDYDNYLNGTVPDSSYNIYGLLLYGVAVCDGYAKTMVYLLEKIDIEVLYVSGYGNGGGHAWNKVKIDGQWYNMDVTWDDPVPNREGYVSYNYFLIPDSKLDDDHSWDNTNLPKANDTKYLFISDMKNPSINNGYYYYSSNSDNIKLYKIKIDGTDKTKISDTRANELVVYGEWIYFSNYSQGGYLFKIKTDGTELTKLNDFHVKNLELVDSVLRYTDEKGLENYSLEVY